jgi:hypothetical protein
MGRRHAIFDANRNVDKLGDLIDIAAESAF